MSCLMLQIPYKLQNGVQNSIDYSKHELCIVIRIAKRGHYDWLSMMIRYNIIT